MAVRSTRCSRFVGRARRPLGIVGGSDGLAAEIERVDPFSARIHVHNLTFGPAFRAREVSLRPRPCVI